MKNYTVFCEDRVPKAGTLEEVALYLKEQTDAQELFQGQFQVIDDHLGDAIDLDLSGSKLAVKERYTNYEKLVEPTNEEKQPESRSRGRPKLGVVSREVTLLPRHWDWLALQPGGASVALRKLIDEARKQSGSEDQMRAMQERTYKAMSHIAAHLPNYEDALRALFALDQAKFLQMIEAWPVDYKNYLIRLAGLVTA
ncbi:DUF2239 family protein [Undibacterium macrobrachii]|jgi:hypothetical protein|uniref:DUF2239 family protein n=1 Tax=Undibacterium macrobrachii TaxID=1119058 RepID=A0ABQ2XL48_9BURK|nr:DUF2239 family protein [Undibacterium macrobrachii]GGX21124.1 hypothetical protein GCM10011282_29100 [Undibacterium macrobrachii]